MITRRQDLFRLASLLPLIVLAAIGRRSLQVDVENLAMKSVGTETAEVASRTAAEFGRDPVLVLLASPRAAEFLIDSDVEEAQRWIAQLESREEVAALEQAPSGNAGEHCLIVHLRTDEAGHYAGAVESFEAFARASVPPTFRLAVSGFPALEVAIARELAAERARLLPIIVAALAAVLLLFYRSPVLVLGALTAPLLGVFLLEGVQGLCSLAVDPVSALLGPAVLTVGVASGVHVLERYLGALREDPSVVRASRAAAHALRVPFLLTATTTIAGFLGLLASPIPAVRNFGVLASLGMLLAIGITFLTLPSLLRLLHRPVLPRDVATTRSSLRHSRWIGAYSLPLVLGCAVATTLAVASFDDTRVDNDPLHVLSAELGVRQESEEIARRLGGSEVFELFLPPREGEVSPLDVAALVVGVAALDGVIGPAGRPQSSRHGYLRLPFLMGPDASNRHEALFAGAERLARDAGWSEASVTGLAVQIARDSNALVRGQREGILATVLGLWVVMAIGFRSWRLALLGLVPNILPLVLINGALGFWDRPVSVASSMIGTVMLGLVVDDTIHLLHAYRRTRGAPLRRMARTFIVVRRPIVVTTAVLCVGFSATLFGELRPTLEFGALAVATLVIALLADLFLLPALLLISRPGAAPGEDPRSVPGLSFP